MGPKKLSAALLMLSDLGKVGAEGQSQGQAGRLH